MTRDEIETKLQEVFFNALDEDGANYPVEVILLGGQKFEGFKIIENNPNYILGPTQEQRMDSVRDREFFQATVVRKNSIAKLVCPMLDFK